VNRALPRRYGHVRYKPGAVAHGFVRRGPATDAIWARVASAKRLNGDPIPVEEARRLFDTDKRWRMIVRGDGTPQFPRTYEMQNPTSAIFFEVRS